MTNGSTKPGKKYTVEELLQYLVSYSDNNALKVLSNQLKTDELNEVLAGTAVSNSAHDGQNYLSAHSYSGFFRTLYNASFLNREMSEKALGMLTLEDFPGGLEAGVPKGIVIASKFGEWVQGEHDEDKQLHEFGIVYHPKGAYIIGVMTQGNDFVKQTEIIRDVSALVYSAVNTSHSK